MLLEVSFREAEFSTPLTSKRFFARMALQMSHHVRSLKFFELKNENTYLGKLLIAPLKFTLDKIVLAVNI
jgi:hypothetical protein